MITRSFKVASYGSARRHKRPRAQLSDGDVRLAGDAREFVVDAKNPRVLRRLRALRVVRGTLWVFTGDLAADEGTMRKKVIAPLLVSVLTTLLVGLAARALLAQQPTVERKVLLQQDVSIPG